ncbi:MULTISPECIES: ABC transporter substrate-binding protein [Brevibacterium]|uniref:ABC transporter substrate-binding protein n=1 Tax=Brevibacterium salitolerans TaxID=1403566 RepID=A0ABN2X5V7_9MICO|nr:ABC transporter substrate-binding protein [Brevibacterium sp.]
MHTRSALPLTAAALSAVLLLSACGNQSASTAAAGEPVSGGTLRIAYDTDPQCVDGQQVGQNTALNVTRQVTDSLTDQDPETGEIVPWLAESWEVSEDSREFTFHLREGVTFQDGTPFTSASVAENFAAIQDLGARATQGSSYLAGLRSVETPDEHTAVVAFEEPNAQFLQATSTMILGFYSSRTLEKTPEERCGGEIVGTGPFALESFTPAESASLVRYDDYAWPSSLARHEGPAHLDGIEITVVPEATVRNGSLGSGQIDVDTAVLPQDEETLEASGFPVLSRPNPGMTYNLLPKESKPIAEEPEVRQAISKAINREELAAVISSHQSPATSVLSQSTPQYTDLSAHLAFDPEGAAALLDEAGWELNAETGIRERDGEPLSIELSYWQTVPFLELVQQQLRAAGIDLRLERATLAEHTAAQEAGDLTFDFYNLTRSDADIIRTVFDARARNVNEREPSEIEDILTETTVTTDPDARTELFEQAAVKLIESGHAIPLVELSGVWATSPEVQGLHFEASSRVQLYDTWLAGEG